MSVEHPSPRVLFRVTSPSRLSIRDGCFQPHKAKSSHGISVPMTTRENLFITCAQFATPSLLAELSDEYFLMLTFRSENLRNLEPAPRQRQITEYFAVAPVDALISASMFSWKSPREVDMAWHNNKNLGAATNYFGLYPIDRSS